MEYIDNNNFEKDFPTITFNKKVLYVNKNCIKHYPNNDYVQIIIDKINKVLLLHPCEINDEQVIPWASYAANERVAKTCSCDYFCSILYDFMDWDIQSKYKIFGHYIKHEGVDFVCFDLKIVEESKKIVKNNKITNTTEINEINVPHQTLTRYKDSNKKELIITTKDEYAFYSIKTTNEIEGDKNNNDN